VRVAALGTTPGIGPATVRRVVAHVLAGERCGAANVSVTFLSTQRMRALNRRTFGRDRATDVIAFGLRHDGQVVGDVYIAPDVARRAARERGIPPREELIRLVVHGTLHVLGYDHPDGTGRTRSAMWTRQERYVHRVLGRGR